MENGSSEGGCGHNLKVRTLGEWTAGPGDHQRDVDHGGIWTVHFSWGFWYLGFGHQILLNDTTLETWRWITMGYSIRRPWVVVSVQEKSRNNIADRTQAHHDRSWILLLHCLGYMVAPLPQRTTRRICLELAKSRLLTPRGYSPLWCWKGKQKILEWPLEKWREEVSIDQVLIEIGKHDFIIPVVLLSGVRLREKNIDFERWLLQLQHNETHENTTETSKAYVQVMIEKCNSKVDEKSLGWNTHFLMILVALVFCKQSTEYRCPKHICQHGTAQQNVGSILVPWILQASLTTY